MKSRGMIAVLIVIIVMNTVCAFAAEGETVEDRYIPKLPPCVTSDGNFNIPYNKDATSDTTTFFANFDNVPHMIVSISYEKDFGIGFVKVPPQLGSSMVFQYNPTAVTPYNHVSLSGNYQYPYQVAEYIYDTTTKELRFLTMRSYQNLQFDYVINSSTLTGKVTNYPYYNTMAGTMRFQSVLTSTGATYTTPRYSWGLASGGGGYIEPDINIDTDGDGKPDLNIDTDGDGEADVNIDTDDDREADLNIDTDGDLEPDVNIDTDEDGKPDVNIDTDGDKKPDINVDTNDDKKPDINIDTNGDKKPDINIDTNGDKKPDINIDTNGDKKPNLNVDTNGDGKADLNIDKNGDGKPDVNIDTNGDGKPDINIDTDGDGKPDTNIFNSSGDSSSWFPEDSYKPNIKDWNLFDPFDYDYKAPSSDIYNPLEGYKPPKMPEISKEPMLPDREFTNPFTPPKDTPDGVTGNFTNPFAQGGNLFSDYNYMNPFASLYK